MRKIKLLLCLLIGFVYACNQNVQPLPEDGGALPVVNTKRPPISPTPTPVSGPMDGGGTLAGTITIAPELKDRLIGSETLYIMARRAMGGAPTAVKRMRQLKFPISYTLTGEDQMVQGTPFTGEVIIIARIDRDGNAGPPQSGDMEGIVPKAMIGNTQVDVLIDKVY
jgi:cytochrome c-type biogenesis protein CcmH